MTHDEFMVALGEKIASDLEEAAKYARAKHVSMLRRYVEGITKEVAAWSALDDTIMLIEEQHDAPQTDKSHE